MREILHKYASCGQDRFRSLIYAQLLKQELMQIRKELDRFRVELEARAKTAQIDEEARKEYQSARGLQKKLADAFPAVPAYQQELAISHNSLAALFADLGKRVEADGEYKKALRLDPGNQEAQHSLEVAERKLQSGG